MTCLQNLAGATSCNSFAGRSSLLALSHVLFVFRCTRSNVSRPTVGSSSETFTEQQAVLSLLLHLRVSRSAYC